MELKIQFHKPVWVFNNNILFQKSDDIDLLITLYRVSAKNVYKHFE